VDFHRLALFRDVARTRSISRAAEEHDVTQSAVTQAVQELERTLDAKLLDRTRRPLVVTPEGELFAGFCKDVLRRQQDFLSELDRIRASGSGGVVRVASIYSIGLTEMARLESAFARRLPEAHVEVDYLRPEKVYAAVAEQKADLGLVSYPESNRDVAAVPWREERMVLAAPPTHPLAVQQQQQHKRVRVAELEGVEFIGFDQDLPISRHIERYFREHGVKVRMVMHFDNIQSMKEALRLGTAVSILPEPMLREEVAEGRIVAIPIQPAISRPLGILTHRRKVLPAAAAAFLDLLQER